MKRYGLIFPAFLLITLLVSACGLGVSAEAPSPTPGPRLTTTALVQTLDAQSTAIAFLQSSGTLTPTNTETPTATETPTSTATPTATETPTSTATPTNTPVPTSTPVSYVAPCYSAAFISDVTFPDGSVLDGGESFTKTWALENTGTCSWNPNFQLIFSSGSLLSASTTVNLPAYVAPGQIVEVSVNMLAPNTNGGYEGFWLLRSDTGVVFGVGGENGPIYVLIYVGSSTETSFAVTSVIMSVDTESVTGTCPVGHEFTFTGDIATNDPGTVTYYWEFSDGAKTGEQSIDFSSAGTESVSASWALGTSNIVNPNPYNGWARIYIDNPNHQTFGEQNFTLTCTNSPVPTNTPTITRTPTETRTPTKTSTPKPTRTPTP